MLRALIFLGYKQGINFLHHSNFLAVSHAVEECPQTGKGARILQPPFSVRWICHRHKAYSMSLHCSAIQQIATIARVFSKIS